MKFKAKIILSVLLLFCLGACSHHVGKIHFVAGRGIQDGNYLVPTGDERVTRLFCFNGPAPLRITEAFQKVFEENPKATVFKDVVIDDERELIFSVQPVASNCRFFRGTPAKFRY